MGLPRRPSAAARSRNRGADPLGRIDAEWPIAHRPSGWLPPRLTGRIAIPLPRGIPPPRDRHYAGNYGSVSAVIRALARPARNRP
jgi:hypothetical protein